MNTERHVEVAEPGENQEGLVINAELLIDDNKSQVSQDRLLEWNEARSNGNLTAYDKCSDARLKTPGNTSISFSTIAAADIPVERLASDRGIARWVALTHFSSGTVEPGKMPKGCGGLAAKGDIKSVEGTDIQSYVEGKIADKDPFIQSLRTAERVADLSDKPTAAFAMDHLSHQLFPIAFFTKTRGILTKTSAIRDYQIAQYDEAIIYSDELPTIDESLLPDDFQEIIATNKAEIETDITKYPDLRARQVVQNPRMVLLSTDIRSASVKFPRHSAIPGSMFKIHLPRIKTLDKARVDEEDLKTGFRQLWYPIHQVPKNHGKADKPFSQTDTLIIETGDLTLSKEIWRLAQENTWMQDWINIVGNKAILLQTNAGKINDAFEVTA